MSRQRCSSRSWSESFVSIYLETAYFTAKCAVQQVLQEEEPPSSSGAPDKGQRPFLICDWNIDADSVANHWPLIVCGQSNYLFFILSETWWDTVAKHKLLIIDWLCHIIGPNGPAALQPTHHLPPENLDPLVSFHTCLSTQIEGPLGEHQAKDIRIG